MELKLLIKFKNSTFYFLLIVPYGIETSPNSNLFITGILLIVPYGIETSIFKNRYYYIFLLLIVPYGIETEFFKLFIVFKFLLIVPYGIETEDEGTFLYSPISFNRTLWN